MPKAALRQAATIDVAAWMPDAEFPVFPVGARAKEAVWAPETVPPELKPGWRYLFKKSKRSYPDQHWGEVIAYRIGCLLGLEVPPAFFAINSVTGVSAALIEWFYDPSENFLHGGDYLVRLRPDYDRDVGTHHNLQDIQVFMHALRRAPAVDFGADWRQWWADALLFDALIGNTDRHQDNWGIVVGPSAGDPARRPIRMSPLFDNGTSLGHERFTERVSGWRDAEFDRYIARGTHHMKWSLDEPASGHLELLGKFLSAWPNTIPVARARLDFEEQELEAAISDLLGLPGSVPLTRARFQFVLQLLRRRYHRLRNYLNEAAAAHR